MNKCAIFECPCICVVIGCGFKSSVMCGCIWPKWRALILTYKRDFLPSKAVAIRRMLEPVEIEGPIKRQICRLKRKPQGGKSAFANLRILQDASRSVLN